MNREQFMETLEELLSDIPDEERDEVLDFYEDYFDDAGEENESEVIAKLGTPEKLALSIRYNLKESNDEYAEYTECGYEDIRMREEGNIPDQYTVVGHSRVRRSKETEESDRRGGQENRNNRSFTKNRSPKFLLAIIFLVFLAPLLKGLAGGLLIGIAVAAAVFFGLPIIGLVVAAAVTLALLVAGIGIIITALPFLITNTAIAILLIGVGMLSFAVVFVGLIVTRWIAVSILPRYLKRFTGFCIKVLEICRNFLKHLRKGGTSV